MKGQKVKAVKRGGGSGEKLRPNWTRGDGTAKSPRISKMFTADDAEHAEVGRRNVEGLEGEGSGVRCDGCSQDGGRHGGLGCHGCKSAGGGCSSVSRPVGSGKDVVGAPEPEAGVDHRWTPTDLKKITRYGLTPHPPLAPRGALVLTPVGIQGPSWWCELRSHRWIQRSGPVEGNLLRIPPSSRL